MFGNKPNDERQAAATREEKERARKATFARTRRASASNIGPPPPCADPKRRDRLANDLVAWHVEAFKHTTGLKPFGAGQLESIAYSRDVIDRGGRVLKLEFRGAGKTCRAAQEALWAIMPNDPATGRPRRQFVVIFASETGKAAQIMEGLKTELMENPLLAELWPEICHPIVAMEGRPQRATAQHINGTPTGLIWRADKIRLPNGGLLMVRSITNANGIQHRSKGQTLRPDLVLLDDLQTYEGARNKNTVRKLQKLITQGICRLGNHAAGDLAIIKTATVMDVDDLPERLAVDPSWLTIRYKMLIRPPTNETLWLVDYAKLRRTHDNTPEGKEKAKRRALRFYKRNRRKMDAGAVVAWQYCYAWNNPAAHEISALQHAYNILIDDGQEAFDCECQNAPPQNTGDLTSETVKTNRDQMQAAVVEIARGLVPLEMQRLVFYIDVHKNLLFYVGTACNLDTGSAHVTTYGTWPPQKARSYHLDTVDATIPAAFPSLNWRAAVERAVGQLIGELNREYPVQGGATLRPARFLIDCNWGPMAARLKRALRNHPLAANLLACHGIGITAKKRPIEDWKHAPGDEFGDGWLKKRQTKSAVTTLLIDTNHYKTAAHLAIATANEVEGALTFHAGDPLAHQLFFDHLLTENEKRTTADRTVHEWTNPKNGQNHFFDCLTGTLAGAAELGTAKTTRRARFKL